MFFYQYRRTRRTFTFIALMTVGTLMAFGCDQKTTPPAGASSSAAGQTGANSTERPVGTPVGKPGMAGIPKN